jgi:hypothetical protein
MSGIEPWISQVVVYMVANSSTSSANNSFSWDVDGDRVEIVVRNTTILFRPDEASGYTFCI